MWAITRYTKQMYLTEDLIATLDYIFSGIFLDIFIKLPPRIHVFLPLQDWVSEQVGSSDNASCLCSGGAGLESRLGQQL